MCIVRSNTRVYVHHTCLFLTPSLLGGTSRLAPLSEGRIHPELGLQCTYHGWTFGSDGACTSIPQMGDAKAHATACSSQRSAVKRYPVKVCSWVGSPGPWLRQRHQQQQVQLHRCWQ
jgi:phenylpropionate dioxygenase-like ring-hydroxylating dioxygenase large terminal subunit